MGRRATGTVEALKGSIRLRFTHLGTRQSETLDLKPTPANLKAAERTLGRICGAIDAGVYRREDFFDTPGKATPAMLFGEYADNWIKTVVLAKSTRRLYGTQINYVWKPALGAMRLTEIRHSDIQAVRAARADEVEPGVVNTALTVIRSIFETAVNDELVTRDPTAKIKNLKVQKTPPDPFTAQERDLILARLQASKVEQVWNYYELAFFTGMRPSELIALRWSSVDWRKRSLKVETAFVEGEEKVTKTSRVRHIDIHDRALAALTRQKAHTFMLGRDAHVLYNPATGKPWASPRDPRENYFKPALRALGMRSRDAYQTRHTFATALLMGGVNPAYISRQLGHASLAMLFDVYGTWLEAADGGLQARKANEVFGGSVHELSTAGAG